MLRGKEISNRQANMRCFNHVSLVFGIFAIYCVFVVVVVVVVVVVFVLVVFVLFTFVVGTAIIVNMSVIISPKIGLETSIFRVYSERADLVFISIY